MPNKKKVAIVHPFMDVGGGSQSVAVWLAMAVSNEFDVTFITSTEADLGKLDGFYGTKLKEKALPVILVPPAQWAKGFDALRGFRLERYCRDHSVDFDVMVSCYNVMDFRRRGIQFIADFSFDDRLRRSFDVSPQGMKKCLYRSSAFRTLYMWSSRVLAGRKESGWRKNLTLANSIWTQTILAKELRLESQVIYPPVTGLFPDIHWADRADGFLVIGRVEPEKKLEFILAVLNDVRAAGHDIHLHILGDSTDREYFESLESRCRDLGGWATMEGLVGGERKRAMIAQHKYGISGRSHEPFGISVAEISRSGGLVWVPDGGGQTEIVGYPELIFKKHDDAVAKIIALLGNPGRQETLSRELRTRTNNFSEENFVKECRDVVSQWLTNNSMR